MDSTGLKILFISSWYPNKVKPSLGNFVKRHAVAVAKLADVSALYVCSDENEGTEECYEDGIYTVRIYYKRVKSKISFISKGIAFIRYVGAWKRALKIYTNKKGKPDLIHVNVVYPVSIIARYLKLAWKVPYIITEHWTGYFPEDGRYKGFTMKFISKMGVKNASAVTVVSEGLKGIMLQKKLNNSYTVISNVVDIGLFNVSATHQKLQDKFNFLHISSLDDHQKNVKGIIRTFAKVNKDTPATTLTIVGPKEETEVMKEFCAGLNITGHIYYMDYIPSKDLAALFHRMHAFVLFSNYETQSIVLLESICSGVPVIATKLAPILEFVTNENGLLVEPGNESQLYEAMAGMIKNRTSYKSEGVRNTCVNNVGSEKIAEQFLQLYKKVLKLS